MIDRKKRINELQKEEFDVVIIGGGITGAGIARDAASRTLKVALLDKGDFGSGTSSKSSRLIHAGLRYIKNREFKLVREGSVERRLLIKLASNKVKPLPFIVPIYKGEKPTGFQMKIALLLYDLLSSFKNYRRHKFTRKEDTLALTDNKLKSDGLVKSVIYYDAQMDDARLTLEVALSAEENGATILNYAKVVSFIYENDKIVGVLVKDFFSGDEFEVIAKKVVCAVGVWTDDVLKLADPEFQPIVRGTKGIHIIIPKLFDQRYAVTLWRKEDGRVMFIIPWEKNYSLVGTTDTDYKREKNDIKIDEEDITYLLSTIKEKFPTTNVTRNSIISAYAGIRPLAKDPNAKSESDISRKHLIFKAKGGIWTIVGGKYTTYRFMAQELVNHLISELGLKGKQYRCQTMHMPLFEENEAKLIERIQKLEKIPKKVADHWVAEYGCRIDDFLTFYQQYKSEQKALIDPKMVYSWIEILFTIHHEYASTLEDVLIRRTQLGYYHLEEIKVQEIAQLMAEKLGWTEERMQKEISEFYNRIWYPSK